MTVIVHNLLTRMFPLVGQCLTFVYGRFRGKGDVSGVNPTKRTALGAVSENVTRVLAGTENSPDDRALTSAQGARQATVGYIGHPSMFGHVEHQDIVSFVKPWTYKLCRTRPTTHHFIYHHTGQPTFCLNMHPILYTHREDTYDYNLGSFHRAVSTQQPHFQRWFDRGLIWSYAFNHLESARCFQAAVDSDSTCAMPYWGLAYALGSEASARTCAGKNSKCFRSSGTRTHVQMSNTPKAAMPIANRLRRLTPDAGHMNHMPSQLDVLVGDWTSAIEANAAACVADEKYRLSHLEHTRDFYTTYRLHNYHSLIYAAMFAGRKEVALDAVLKMKDSLSEELVCVQSPPLADWLEVYCTVRVQ